MDVYLDIYFCSYLSIYLFTYLSFSTSDRKFNRNHAFWLGSSWLLNSEASVQDTTQIFVMCVLLAKHEMTLTYINQPAGFVDEGYVLFHNDLCV